MTEQKTKFDEATRKRVQQVAQASQEVSTKLWFLDLKFETFATPSLVGFAFLAWMAICVLVIAGTAVYALFNYTALQAVIGVIATALVLLIYTILVRVFFESLLLTFRIAEHLKDIASAAQNMSDSQRPPTK